MIRPAVPEHLHDVWAMHGHENPLVERFGRTRDTRAYRFSDVVSSDELHSLALYREFYAELEVEHQIAFVIDATWPRSAMNRSGIGWPFLTKYTCLAADRAAAA